MSREFGMNIYGVEVDKIQPGDEVQLKELLRDANGEFVPTPWRKVELSESRWRHGALTVDKKIIRFVNGAHGVPVVDHRPQ